MLTDNVNYAEIFSEVLGIYYRKQADSIVYNALDDDNLGKLIINFKDTLKWKLTNETKTIDNYTCYKATSSYQIDNGLKLYTNNVVAWYCPALPFQYGPKGFGGLPGLIFEIQDQRVNFGIISIKQIEKLRIQKPEEGRSIKKVEYDKLLMNLDNEN
jgi:GLPGLI family protein